MLHAELLEVKLDSITTTEMSYNSNTRIVRETQKCEIIYTVQIKTTDEWYDDNSEMLSIAIKDTLNKLNNK